MSKEVKLDFDEALYIYTLLRQCDGILTPDAIDIEARLERYNEEEKQRIEEIAKKPIEVWITDEIAEDDSHWNDCQFYARIVPKLLRAYPEIYRMRSQ